MNPVIGKTVYVLGAGASWHAGAPLLNDFLVTARMLREGKTQLTYKDSFKRVFEWLDTLRGASYYVEFDLDNLEHVFSLAEMKKQLGDKDGQQLSEDLNYIIMETLDIRPRVTFSKGRFFSSSTYKQFASVLSDLNEQRTKRFDTSQEDFSRDAIITFNYDVMLDYAMDSVNYCLDTDTFKNDRLFKLLKLHGSTNWAACQRSECKNNIQVVKPKPTFGGNIYAARKMREGESGDIPFKMVTSILKEAECKECHQTGVLAPTVIPPTWSKKIDDTPLPNVWTTAVKEIEEACQLVVIGYSMPPTDTFFSIPDDFRFGHKFEASSSCNS